MDKFDLLMYVACIGTIVASAVFGTWALLITMSLQGLIMNSKEQRRNIYICLAAMVAGFILQGIIIP